MPYQIGNANDFFDLLDKLRLFLIENGWNVNLYADDISSYRTYPSTGGAIGKRLHVSRNGVFLNFRAALRHTVYSRYYDSAYPQIVDGINQYVGQFTGIAFYRSTGFNSSLSWDLQPGFCAYSGDFTKSLGSGVRLTPAAVPSYRFFLTNDPFCLFVSIEHEVGKFRNMLLCDLIKYGSYVGGECSAGSVDMYEHYTSSNWDSAPFDNKSTSVVRVVGQGYGGGDWCFVSQSGSSGYLIPLPTRGDASAPTSAVNYDMDFMLLACAPSNYTGIVPMIPLRLSRRYNANEHQLIGEVPGIRYARSGYKTGDIITMGTDRWMAIPYASNPAGGISTHFMVPYDGV